MTQRVSAKERFKRFLYTSSEEPRYVTGNPEKHNYYNSEVIPSIREILQSQNPEVLLNIIELVNSENLLPRRETIFIALAYAAVTNQTVKDVFRHKIYTTLLNVCRCDEELFLFVKYYIKHKKTFSSALNKAVTTYYTKKDPLDLAKRVSAHKGYHGWKHKDLLKLSHCKSDNLLITLVISYILFGLKKAKDISASNPTSELIITHLSKVEDLKRCENETTIVKLIPEVAASISQVPSFFHKSKNVWEALVPFMSVPEIINLLPTLHKYGFFKGNCPVQSKVVSVLTNPEKVRESKIYPSEIFIGMKNFEKGGKPMDPKLKSHLDEKEANSTSTETANKKTKFIRVDPPKCPAIISALNKALRLSYANLQPTGKRIMITIEMSDKMDKPCLGAKNITCLEAAVTMLLSIIRVEREVCVAVFSNERIHPVVIDKSMPIHQIMNKLKQAKSGYILPSAVFEWAMNKKKSIDVFISFIANFVFFGSIPKDVRDKEKPMEALNKYRKKMNLPHAKWVSFSLCFPRQAVADGSLNVMDICGFDKEVPKVLEAFCRGSFS